VIVHVAPDVVEEEIPDWLAEELRVMGEAISVCAERSNALPSGYGPSHVVNHALVMLLRLVHMEEGGTTVQMLHSALDLAATQYRRGQN